MLTVSTNDFPRLFYTLDKLFMDKPQRVKNYNWQGTDVSDKPEMELIELTNITMGCYLKSSHGNLNLLAKHIKPNLPWADNHFKERVCGKGINPGVEWKNWPYNQSAERFLQSDGKFNHNYMERYWPKYVEDTDLVRRGIRYEYGDLNDVVNLLVKDPFTRQAYLPIFFPEDTGRLENGRKPCSLGYHFMRRDDSMTIYYPMRSCDYIRHFRDDIYLTIRLLIWVIKECENKDPQNWENVFMSEFIMFCSSLHMFRNDYITFMRRDKS